MDPPVRQFRGESTEPPLTLPPAIRHALSQLRRRVRLFKTAESAAAAAFFLLVSLLLLAVCDRVFDTPVGIRCGLTFGGWILAAAVLAFGLWKWVWKTRRPEQVAGVLKRRLPALGDDVLSVLELVHGESDPGSSGALKAAAVHQVDRRVQQIDPAQAMPVSRHRTWGLAAGGSLLILLSGLVLAPAMSGNAVRRWLVPWSATPRYTFVQLEPLPELVVVRGESFPLTLRHAAASRWQPAKATVRGPAGLSVTAPLAAGGYRFDIPPLTQAAVLDMTVGDLSLQRQVTVVSRPELTRLEATVRLPEYLQRDEESAVDARAGTISVVRGSAARLAATIDQRVTEATLDGTPAPFQGDRITVPSFVVDRTQTRTLRWSGTAGFAAHRPFDLTVQALDDTAPGIMLRPEDSEPVVLSTDVVTFEIQARDDFGVRAVGLEWHGQVDSETDLSVESESRLVRPGSPTATRLTAIGTFCADTERVRPQTLEVRAWADDYHPERERRFSPAVVIHVLSPDQHAAWLTRQLRRWASVADDVYEEELRLHDANRRLRQLDSDQRRIPENRRRLQQQAAAERENADRLAAAAVQGEQLIRRATRNPAMQAGHLEVWAGALRRLQDISATRMPTVADLLTQAARATDPPAQATVADPNRPGQPTVGVDRRKPDETQPPENAGPVEPPTAPQINDIESGTARQNPSPADPDTDDAADPGRLGLPSTALTGGPQVPANQSATDVGNNDEAVADDVEDALREQAELLSEFQAVRDDLQNILDDLENSTFVKRLKSASRQQLGIAADLNRTLVEAFGRDVAALERSLTSRHARIADRAEQLSSRIADIESDLRAFVDRSQQERFATILAEMGDVRVIDETRELAAVVRRNHVGEAIARAEYWSDTLDRWAEQLVAPSQISTTQGEGASASLPPVIVLELMRILKGEVDLREQTRAAEQARPGLEPSVWRAQAATLSQSQQSLQQRVHAVLLDLVELPGGAVDFADELEILELAGLAMHEAAQILERPDTGSEAVAAETEAIELLLRSRRTNPGGQAGSGAAPGGGGEGTTNLAALTLSGTAGNSGAVIEERGVSHTGGLAADRLPEEFREGLDALFDALEQ